jgi:multimeric flavodoxin WrbA
MKVLAIMGSPRKKGNTFQAVARVKDILSSLDKSLDFEYLFLADCRLEMCKGCFTCFAKGEDKCPLKDDRDLIYSKMTEADGIILAAPTYAMGVPALMKNFIDRLAYTLHRPCFFDKAFLAVSTVGGVMGMKQALEQLALLSSGAKKALRLGVPMPPICMPMLEKKATKRIRKTTGQFYKAMQKTKRKLPGFADFAYFGAFKTMSAFESYKNACPADNAYYQHRSAYFYPIEGHAVRRFFGRLFIAVMRLSFKMIVKDKQPDTQSAVKQM